MKPGYAAVSAEAERAGAGSGNPVEHRNARTRLERQTFKTPQQIKVSNVYIVSDSNTRRIDHRETNPTILANRRTSRA